MSDDGNKTRYDEYDSRPIKPLDKNVLDKQLSEYNEISSEELEQLKKRTIQHIRAKTAEAAIKLPQQKNFTRTPPAKKLSFNLNQANNNSHPSKIRRRTMDETKTNKLSAMPNNNLQKVKNIVQRNSPKPQTSNYLSHLNQLNNNTTSINNISNNNSTNSSSKIINSSIKQSVNKRPTNGIRNLLTATKTIDESDEDQILKKSNENLNEDTENSSSSIKKTKQAESKALTQLKHSEIHSRIQKQRQEMLLSKQKSLNEFKNQLRIKQEEAKRVDAYKKQKINRNLTCIFSKSYLLF